MERLLARLELRFGRLALPNITWYLVALQAFCFVIELTHPGFVQHLALDRDAIMRGQVWRLVTYLAIPPTMSPIWVLFELYWLYLMGTSLEAQWGAFKLQAYLFIGMLLTTIGAFAFGIPATNVYLMSSLFLAFATLFPEFKVMVLFVFPVPVKWLGLLAGAAMLAMVGLETGMRRLLPVLAVGNYLLFFLPTLAELIKRGAKQGRRAGALHEFKRKSEAASTVGAVRKCTLCGVTSEDPSAEFRVCTCEKCGGKPTEFCLAHARAH